MNRWKKQQRIIRQHRQNSEEEEEQDEERRKKINKTIFEVESVNKESKSSKRAHGLICSVAIRAITVVCVLQIVVVVVVVAGVVVAISTSIPCVLPSPLYAIIFTAISNFDLAMQKFHLT